MVPARGIEPRAHPYHGRVLPLYYAGENSLTAQLVYPRLSRTTRRN